MKLDYIVSKNDFSIMQILKNKFNMSSRYVLKLKQNNCIFLNSVPVRIDAKVELGDLLSIVEKIPEDSSNIVPNSNIKLNILFEDEYMLIVDKPYNMPVHPSILHFEDSLSNGIKYYFKQIGLNKKIRPVNRLDRDTSGIVIFAKNEYIQECLVKQMKQNIFKKFYIAMLERSFRK